LAVSTSATAGGLTLPGAGPVSVARAGAAAASTDDGEALTINPAGMAKSKGTTITIGVTALNYDMSFQRNGTYDTNDIEAETYEGQRYPVVSNHAKPDLGIGRYLTIPTIAIVSDLGGVVPNLRVGAGLYTVIGYPNRNMNYVNGKPYFVPADDGGYDFPVFGSPPPPTRYDIIEQSAVPIAPTIGASYRVLPNLDVGARFTAAHFRLKSTLALWGGLSNYYEQIRKDAAFTLDASGWTYSWGLGANFRATPNIEVAAVYNAQVDISAKGDALAHNGPGVDLSGQPVVVLPVPDSSSRCAKGGTAEVQKGCVDFALPMSATLGARYKFLDTNGAERGDVELDVQWENWGAPAASTYKVVVDAKVTPENLPEQGITLKDNDVRHGLRDTYSVLLGGSWRFAQGDNTIIARGGVGYETGAAKKNWERADFDGAKRVLLTAGGSYKLPRVQINAGFGIALQGTRSDSRTCNPDAVSPPQGCGPNGAVQSLDDREGPDPIKPLVVTSSQAENPINQGTFKSHYLMFMIGASTWF
jgi:long-subunit fatty acid transport protein